MKKDNIKKGDITISQLIKMAIFIAVFVIVFLGTTSLYGKEINWLSWLPGFDSTKTPTGIYVIRYDTASRGVQSYDGATWEDFENDVNTGQGIFNLEDKRLTDVDLKRDFEGFYYDEAWRDEHEVNRGPNNKIAGWPYIVGFEKNKNGIPYLNKDERGYVVIRDKRKNTAYSYQPSQEYKLGYYTYSPSGKLYYKSPMTCCDEKNYDQKFTFSAALIDKNSGTVQVNKNILDGIIEFETGKFITTDVLNHLKRLNGIKLINENEFYYDELLKKDYQTIFYGSVDVIDFMDPPYNQHPFNYWTFISQFYYYGIDKEKGEPVDIWIVQHNYYSSEKKEVTSKGYLIYTSIHSAIQYDLISNPDSSEQEMIKWVNDWKNSIFVKPIGINVYKDEKANSDKEIKYYCGKLYDGRYIVVDLGIEVKKEDVCGGNLT